MIVFPILINVRLRSRDNNLRPLKPVMGQKIWLLNLVVHLHDTNVVCIVFILYMIYSLYMVYVLICVILFTQFPWNIRGTEIL